MNDKTVLTLDSSQHQALFDALEDEAGHSKRRLRSGECDPQSETAHLEAIRSVLRQLRQDQ